jgi:hypothetical protein
MLGQPLAWLAEGSQSVSQYLYVCLVFSSHQVTYDNRNEYVPPTLPYLANTKICFAVNRVSL